MEKANTLRLCLLLLSEPVVKPYFIGENFVGNLKLTSSVRSFCIFNCHGELTALTESHNELVAELGVPGCFPLLCVQETEKQNLFSITWVLVNGTNVHLKN